MKNKIITLFILFLSTSLYAQKDTPPQLEPSLIKADIDTLIHVMKQCHPTYLDYYNENNIASIVDSIKATIIQPISSLDFFRLMQPIVSIDGHTTITYRGEIEPEVEAPYFPFKVIIKENKLYVRENLSSNQSIIKGSAIERINNVAVNEVINNLIRYLPGEKRSYKIAVLERQFHHLYRLVYGSFSEYEIKINAVIHKVYGVKIDDFQEAPKPAFELRFYDDDIAYLYKRNFSPPRDFVQFVDSAFQIINEKQIRYLIIDNLKGGGLTDLTDTLLSYFSNNPYTVFEKKVTKISPMTKDFVESKIAEGKGSVGGDYFVEEFYPHDSPRKNIFKGTTYILTGPLSYSAATCFPAAAKCYNEAIIVGEETGQPLLSNGGLSGFILPNTGLMCYTSLSRIYMPCNQDDNQTGVIPDYKITPTMEELLNDEDYTLKYALRIIRDSRSVE